MAVTVDPAELRDRASALPYARKAVELSKSQDPLSLHVLPQAYAGARDYAHAMEVEEKALAQLPAVEPGKPAPRNRAIIERALEEHRKH